MKKAFIYLIGVFVANLFSLYYGWYLDFWWIDIVFHFLGGFFMAMFLADYLKDHFLPNKFISNTLIVVGATIFIGVVWEFSEYLANQILVEPFYDWFGITAYFMGDLVDTIVDLLMDILGALAFIGLYRPFRKQ
jgi:hypothetical protein